MTPWLLYLIAFVIACHGITYIMFGVLAPDGIQGWKGTSWILSSALTGDKLKALVLVLHATAGVAIIACAVAIVFGPSLPGWWRPLAIAGAALGLAGFAVFLDGQPQLVVQEGGFGATISAILLVAATAFPGAFG